MDRALEHDARSAAGDARCVDHADRAAFLGYNPIGHLLGPGALHALSAHQRTVLTGPSFFSHLISAPFRSGLHAAFAFAIVACLVAAAASLMRGGRVPAEERERTHTPLKVGG